MNLYEIDQVIAALHSVNDVELKILYCKKRGELIEEIKRAINLKLKIIATNVNLEQKMS